MLPNDPVAFLAYGHGSLATGPISGIDSWFKRVEYPIIDKWYSEHLQGDSYHEDRGEGYDAYHAGTSRGTGGLALWLDKKPYPAGHFQSAKLISNNGKRIEFKLIYQWQTPIGFVIETRNTALQLGSQLFHVNSRFTLDGKPSSLPIAIGLTTHNQAAIGSESESSGQISTWEVIDGLGVSTGALVNPEVLVDVIHSVSDEPDESHIWLITKSDSC